MTELFVHNFLFNKPTSCFYFILRGSHKSYTISVHGEFLTWSSTEMHIFEVMVLVPTVCTILVTVSKNYTHCEMANRVKVSSH